jgi:hypothetical protein
MCVFLISLSSKKRTGKFIEAGAADGEFYSNTLWLERELGWTGLLVEALPILFAKLRNKRRRAWLAPACISPNNTWEFVRQHLFTHLQFYA